MNATEVDRLYVFSHWCGFAEPCTHDEILEVVNNHGQFTLVEPRPLQGSSISELLVSALLASLQRKPEPYLCNAQLGALKAVIEEHYRSDWTDDGPAIRVKVILKSGVVVTADSDAQHQFMLPWAISSTSGVRTEKTYDLAISRAIAAILPPDFMHRERLNGTSLTEEALTGEHPDEFDDVVLDPIEIDENVTLETLLQPPPRQSASKDDRILNLVGSGFDLNLFNVYLKERADINACDEDGNSALMIASGWRRRQFLALLEAGADPNIANNRGVTPLMNVACHPEFVKLLLEKGADATAVDSEGVTTLMYASNGSSSMRETRKIESCELLLGAGADATARDENGNTALTHAFYWAERYRLDRLVSAELFPGRGENTEFEMHEYEENNHTFEHFPSTDGIALCCLLEAAGARP